MRAKLALAECAIKAGDHAEAAGLLELAAGYGSPKYRTLGLTRRGQHEEAAVVPAPLGSDALLAQVIPRAGRPHRAGPPGALAGR